MIASSRDGTTAGRSVAEELEKLKKLKDANAISVFDFDEAKKALIAKLGK